MYYSNTNSTDYPDVAEMLLSIDFNPSRDW
jgi:hypothetical protein